MAYKKGKKRTAQDGEAEEPLIDPAEPQQIPQQVEKQEEIEHENAQVHPQQEHIREEELQQQIPVQTIQDQQMMDMAQNPQLVQQEQIQGDLENQIALQNAQAQANDAQNMQSLHLEESVEAPPKKKRRARSKAKAGDENPHVLIDENGKEIPIPPRHGTPIKHARPKRPHVPRKSGLEEEANMLIKVHLRRIEGDPEAAQDTLPSATVHAHPSMTLDALRRKISTFCPSLPPRAQHFFKKVDGDNFQRIDSSSRYTKCLRTVGFDEPGPHEIWVEIDLTELFKGEGADAGIIGEHLTQADMAGVSQAHAIHGVVQDPALLTGGETPGSGMLDDQNNMVIEQPGPITHHRSINKRSNKKWTEEEVEHLLLGLMKYGTSSWTTIAKTWKFEDRTTVDLKDKWRNLVKNVRDGRVMRGMVLTEEARNRVWRIIHENGIEATPQNQRFHTELITPPPAPENQEFDPNVQQIQALQMEGPAN